MNAPEIAIVGAGVAGLAAASFLARRGARVILLEALPRAGGRAFTDHPAALGGVPFDHGASWLHSAERNPLARLGRWRGEALIDTARARQRLVIIAGRPATEAELAARDAADAALEAALVARAGRPGADPSFAAALDDLPPNPWHANSEAIEATLIAAADPARLSLADWRANRLEGTNLLPPEGLGAYVLRLLAPPAGVLAAATAVSRIDWGGGGVTLETPRGTVAAKAAIVTVSTGVLAAGHITFTPALPVTTASAIAALPMGLLSKVALRAEGAERLDLPPGCFVERRLDARGEPFMAFNAWPRGRDHVVGFIGGGAAWALARAGVKAAEDFARAELARLFGTRAARAFAPGAVATTWGSDATFLGAYAYPLPGAAAARLALATPLAGGRLAFAGEACHPTLAGTVAGAFISGRAAARAAWHAVGCN